MRKLFFEQLPALRNVLVFSLLINVLLLTPALYMLQVYDRVVNSRSLITLLMLTLLVVGLYMLLEVFEWIRGRLMNEVGVTVDRRLREGLLHALFTSRLRDARSGGVQFLNDLKVVRESLPSGAILAVFDAPLALLILVLLFMINPLLGWFAVGGRLYGAR